MRPFEAISNNPKTSLSPRWVHVHSGREPCYRPEHKADLMRCCTQSKSDFNLLPGNLHRDQVSLCHGPDKVGRGGAASIDFLDSFSERFPPPQAPPRPFGGPQKAKKPEKTLGKAKVTALGLSGSPQAPPKPFGGPQKAKKR